MCCALVRITGLDLAVMQVEAWAGMIYERSEQGLVQAVYSTLSGEAPCEKCQQVREQRKEQNENTFCFSSLDKLKLPLNSNRQESQTNYGPEELVVDFSRYLAFPLQIYLGVESPPPRV